ncbi:SDR family oxidoreductase [Tumebacillus permanentifrigoris]|uniref:Short-subunit dehydrogenase n=1 Tax=Tumebacillus permanentifrigoris TaxID=378543 RepID=A0A316D8N4_9BACL|nr:SDR family oxidoreductase [Tumebacillus permanentifrigoris]PWK13047.1 short-subunit dehydrogenase [Tumebacillus permanentifrigoris]
MKRKVVLITGTSSGFGLLASIALLREGYYVVATMRDLDRNQALKQAVREAGLSLADMEMLQLDVTDERSIHGVVDDVLARLGQIDVLINNAGYAHGGFIEEIGMEEYRAQFETNFFGAVAMTKAVLPSMRERRTGKIVMISSISGRFGFPGMSPYTSSKHALEGFSESLRHEMRPFGVHVVLIEPASYRTPIWSKSLENAGPLDDQSPYSAMQKKMARFAKAMNENGSDPREVIDLISRVLRDKSPGLRYPVGKGLKPLLLAIRFLPQRLIDKMVAKRM